MQKDISAFSDVLNPLINKDTYSMTDQEITRELLMKEASVEVSINKKNVVTSMKWLDNKEN